MERVYLVKDPKKITSLEAVKRQGYTVREAKSLGFEDEGYYIYLKGAEDFFEKIKDELDTVELIEEEKSEKIIKEIKKEEEKSIAGANVLG